MAPFEGIKSVFCCTNSCKVAAEKVWLAHFGSFFAPLYFHLWPDSTILKTPRLSQLLSLFDLLFEVFSENLSYFHSLKSSILQHKDKLSTDSTPPSPPSLSSSQTTTTTTTAEPKSKRRRLSAAPLLPVTLSVPSVPSSSSSASFTPSILSENHITDVTHPNHVNHTHLQNLLNLFYVFIPVLKMYKAQLRDPKLGSLTANLQRLLYIFVSCPSPSYISALFLQLSQFYSWEGDLPDVLQHLLNNASLLNEDLGEISLSKIREHSPTIRQSPDLLSKHYMLSGMYSSFDVNGSLKVKYPSKVGMLRIQLKLRISSYFTTVFLPKISSSVPYLYFQSLPPSVYKLKPKVTPPSVSAPPSIILKTKQESQKLLLTYAANTYKLLQPKEKRQKKQKKATTTTKDAENSRMSEEDEDEEEGDAVWTSHIEEEEESPDYQFVSILSHKKSKEKEILFLVELDSLDNKGRATKWIPESELFDCEELLLKYWNEE